MSNEKIIKLTKENDYNLKITLSYNTIIDLYFYEGFNNDTVKHFHNNQKYSKTTSKHQGKIEKNDKTIFLNEKEINDKFIEMIINYINDCNINLYNIKNNKKLNDIKLNDIYFIDNIDNIFLNYKLNNKLTEKGTSKKINKI